MIGHVIAAYCEGRRDARHGKRRKMLRSAAGELSESQNLREFYLLGVEDERRQMRLDRRLVQYEMDLDGGK